MPGERPKAILDPWIAPGGRTVYEPRLLDDPDAGGTGSTSDPISTIGKVGERGVQTKGSSSGGAMGNIGLLGLLGLMRQPQMGAGFAGGAPIGGDPLGAAAMDGGGMAGLARAAAMSKAGGVGEAPGVSPALRAVLGGNQGGGQASLIQDLLTQMLQRKDEPTARPRAPFPGLESNRI